MDTYFSKKKTRYGRYFYNFLRSLDPKSQFSGIIISKEDSIFNRFV